MNDINNSLTPLQPNTILTQLKDTLLQATDNFNKSSERLQFFLTNGTPEQQLQAAMTLHNSDSSKDVIKQAEILLTHLATLNFSTNNPSPSTISPSFNNLQLDNTTTTSHEIEISPRPNGPPLTSSLLDLYIKVMTGQKIQLISAVTKETNLFLKVHFQHDVNVIMDSFSSQTFEGKKAIEYVNLKSTSASRNVIRVIGIPLPTLNPLLQNDPNYTALKDHIYSNNPHFFDPGDIISIQHYQSINAQTKEKKLSYTLKLTITVNSFAKFLSKKEENTRLILHTTQSFKVYEEVVPSYCHQCLSFDHYPTCSQKLPQCRYCLAQHYSSACLPSNRSNPHCISCHRKNSLSPSFNVNDSDHAAVSTFCPIYKAHRDSKRMQLKADAQRNFLVTSLPQRPLLPPVSANLNSSTLSLIEPASDLPECQDQPQDPTYMEI